jgi:hypothetical protein
MNSLLNDTLRFLEESFEPGANFLVKSSQVHLKRAKKVEKEPLQVPKKIASIPLPAPPPPPKEKPQAPLFSKAMEKEPVVKPALGVESLSSAIKDLFPGFTTHKEPPKDKDLRVDPIYKKVLQAEVVLFSFREGKESDLFLQNISLAITSHFTPAAVLDVKKWELVEEHFDLFFKQGKAKFFIGSETVYKKSYLLPFLKEIPSSSQRFLSDRPLLLLRPFESYFNNPLQKKELWNTLCTALKKLSQASS